MSAHGPAIAIWQRLRSVIHLTLASARGSSSELAPPHTPKFAWHIALSNITRTRVDGVVPRKTKRVVSSRTLGASWAWATVIARPKSTLRSRRKVRAEFMSRRHVLRVLAGRHIFDGPKLADQIIAGGVNSVSLVGISIETKAVRQRRRA